jgi:uncharacterized protein (DUF2267 family)
MTAKGVDVSDNEVPLIERSARTIRHWLDELAQELGRPHDQKYALHVLRGFLHTVRDRLPVTETAHLGAQLPVTVRGIFYEEWRPAETPLRYHSLDAFLHHLAAAASLSGDTEASFAAEAAARVLARHLAPGEITKVGAVLPRGVADLLSMATAGEVGATEPRGYG